MAPLDGGLAGRAPDAWLPGVPCGFRFATVADVGRPAFAVINDEMVRINRTWNLPRHTQVNQCQFPWSARHDPGGELYAPRLWEFPFAALAAELAPGMACADVGCGKTPFSIYLQQAAECQVTGFDPDCGSAASSDSAFGVDGAYIGRVPFPVVMAGMDQLPVHDASFDRVFCLSVIEHVTPATARQGVREMARVLRPSGLLVITMDVSLACTFCDADPLSLVWHSGLIPAGPLDLRWPELRLGRSHRSTEPLDVCGLVLRKDPYEVDERFAADDTPGGRLAAWRIPSIRRPPYVDPAPERFLLRVVKAVRYMIHGAATGNIQR